MSRRPGTAPRAYPGAMPLAAWPRADRQAWQQAIVAASGFLEEGSSAPAARWSERRRRNALLDAGRFVAWLVSAGTPPTDTMGLAMLATPERLAGFARAELARGLRLNSVATAVGNVIGVAASLDPDHDWKPAWAVLDRLRVRARRLAPGPRHLVRPEALYGLGIALMEGALDAAGQVDDLEAWQDGLMVALLTACPMRIANFAALTLERHLRRGEESWSIELAAEETKTKRADSWPVEGDLVLYLQHHLAEVRPVFLARGRRVEDIGALWLGAFGRPLGHQGVRTRIKDRTAEAFGRPVLPHSFRHSAATGFALDHPERPREAAALLGHAGPRTTERHYILSQRQLALEQMQRAIERRRRGRTSDGEEEAGAAWE